MTSTTIIIAHNRRVMCFRSEHCFFFCASERKSLFETQTVLKRNQISTKYTMHFNLFYTKYVDLNLVMLEKLISHRNVLENGSNVKIALFAIMGNSLAKED